MKVQVTLPPFTVPPSFQHKYFIKYMPCPLPRHQGLGGECHTGPVLKSPHSTEETDEQLGISTHQQEGAAQGAVRPQRKPPGPMGMQASPAWEVKCEEGGDEGAYRCGGCETGPSQGGGTDLTRGLGRGSGALAVSQPGTILSRDKMSAGIFGWCNWVCVGGGGAVGRWKGVLLASSNRPEMLQTALQCTRHAHNKEGSSSECLELSTPALQS